jgi:energy-coupling factor transporter ATP-binding protein EcfA2
MDALEAGRRAIAGYVDTVASFLEGKSFDFRPTRGVVIADSETSEELNPSDLSSGEKQILVLFSDVVALRERTGLFLIDEPELSLNPQWQRHLMSALLASTEGSEMQLVAATHSIEIMSKYRDRLRQLVDA